MKDTPVAQNWFEVPGTMAEDEVESEQASPTKKGSENVAQQEAGPDREIMDEGQEVEIEKTVDVRNNPSSLLKSVQQLQHHRPIVSKFTS